MNTLGNAIGCFALAFAAWAAGGSLLQQAPPRFAGLTNPLEGDEQAERAGAKLFARECAACHGHNGEGAGSAPPLRRSGVYEAPPGTLFWVLRNGSLHHGMPSFAHLPEPERWQIVTFLKQLSRPDAPAKGR